MQPAAIDPVRFAIVDYIVLIGYLLAMLAVGVACSKRVTSSRAFFIGEGRLNYILVGFSLLGTYLSALTMMALPGNSFGAADWTFTIQLPFLLITAFLITRVVLPRYRDAGVISVYQYLEQRIDVSARLLASGSFVIFSIARMGLVLYLPALALSEVTQFSLPAMILAMGVIVTLYTAIGGLEAVVWTDTIQVLVFIVAAIVSVAYILAVCGGEFFVIANEAGKFRVSEPTVSVLKVSSLWLVLETIVSTIRIYGTQQDMTQRYVATDSTARANRSVWISILTYIPLGYLFYFMGTALFVYYQVHPADLPSKPDAIFPYFVTHVMPPGVAGLVIAGIFAASMSTISSLMNSSSTVCVEDFYKRFAKVERRDEHYLRSARWLTVGWGVLHIAMAFSLMGIDSALVVWQKIMGIFTNGVLGLMVLAFLPFRVHKPAALAGFVGSYLILLCMMFTAAPLVEPFWLVLGSWPSIAVLTIVVTALPWKNRLPAAICTAGALLFIRWVAQMSEPMVWLLWTVFGNLWTIVIALLLNAALGPVERVARETGGTDPA